MIYNWEKEKSRGDSHEIYAAMSGHRVIFGKSSSGVNAGLDVIEGKTPSLQNDKLLLAPGSRGTGRGGRRRTKIQSKFK